MGDLPFRIVAVPGEEVAHAIEFLARRRVAVIVEFRVFREESIEGVFLRFLLLASLAVGLLWSLCCMVGGLRWAGFRVLFGRRSLSRCLDMGEFARVAESAGSILRELVAVSGWHGQHYDDWMFVTLCQELCLVFQGRGDEEEPKQIIMEQIA